MPKVIEETLKILGPADPAWKDLFNRLPVDRQDVFYLPEYAEIAAQYLHKDGEPFCAILESEEDFILYPFLQRKLETLLSDTDIKMDGYDIHGLYGRDGLIMNHDNPELLARFHHLFAGYCKEQRILCGFDRFHPVIENNRWVSEKTKVIDIGGFIVADLQKPIETIESEFKHSVRKNIKKAERAGIQVFSESNLDHLADYLTIYSHTMDRHDARAFYYVDPAYYRAIAEKLPGKFRFFYATFEGQAVSCELVLIQGHYYHSFLGGTLNDAMDKCPNHLLKREIIRYAKANGGRHYLLGGGETPFNGVWAYKQCFAPDGNRPSYAGGTIFDAEAYDGLRKAMTQQDIEVRENRFQFYDRH